MRHCHPMSEFTAETPVHFVDTAGNSQGPVSVSDVVERIRRGELSPQTNVWWPEAPGWVPADQVPGLRERLTAPPPPGNALPPPPAAYAPPPESALTSAPAGATSGGDLLMGGLSDQDLDDTFTELIDRSWSLYKQTEKATTIDEAIFGGIITAMVDSGFVLIDVASGMAPVSAATTTTTPTTTASTTVAPPPDTHDMRFELAESGARVTITLTHLTPDLASAQVIGHRARLDVGYGERVANAGQIRQALRSEIASAFVATPEPGNVVFDADISSGYVYASIDVLIEPEKYVNDALEVDHDLLRRHIASLVHTMRTFVRTRFAS